jgi:PAS domain S-box-containing protein
MVQPFEQSQTKLSLEKSNKILTEELTIEGKPGVDPERSRMFEIDVYRKDGSTYPVESTVSFLRNTNGNIKGIIGINRDITQRRIAEKAFLESEARYRMIVNHSFDAIYFRKGHKYEFVNPKFCELTGYSAEEITSPDFDISLLVNDGTKKMLDDRAEARYRGDDISNEYEVNITNRDGKHIDLEVVVVPLQEDETLAVVGFMRDITDRKIAEKELINAKEKAEENEIRFKALHNASFGGIAIHDKGMILDCNQGLSDITGYSIDELIGMNGFLLISVSKRGQVLKNIQNDFEKSYLAIGVRKNGEEYPLRLEAKIIPYLGKKVRVVEFRDISESQKAEDALEESEEKYRRLTENAKDMIYRMSLPDGIYEYVSPASDNLYGYTPQEFYDNPLLISNIIHPDWTEYFIKEWKNLLLGNMKSHYRYQIIHKSGKIKWMDQRNVLIKDDKGKAIAIEGIVTDVTDSKMAEDALMKSEERSRSILVNASDGIYFRSDGRYEFVNPRFCEITGYSKEELLSTDFDINVLLSDDTSKILHDRMQRRRRGEEIPSKVQVSIINKSGKRIDTEVTIVFQDKEEKLISMGFIQDISERKRAEDALKKQQAMQSSMIANISDVLGIMDSKGIVKYKSPNIEMHFGWKPEDLVGISGWDTVHPVDLDRIKAKFESILLHDRAKTTVEYRYKCKSGKYTMVQLTAVNLLNDPSVQGVLLNYHDISERKRAEEELQRMSKLESLGILAGGIAHNFKNILANISVNINLAKFKPELADEYYQNMDSAVDQASALATRFQTFSTGGAPIIETICLDSVVKDAVNIALSGSEVDSHLEIGENLLNIMADSKQLNEVFLNLIINSKQAMPKGGRIDINLNNTILEEGNKFQLDKGNYVIVTVKDSGNGIPKDKLSKIFDPFYSNKVGGTGLGLSSVQMIIEKHQGKIFVDSMVGKWTQFDIFLPATDVIADDTSIEEKNMITNGKGNKVLYVDDDLFLRDNISVMGGFIDFDIQTAKDGIEGIEKYRKAFESDEKFDAVILDLTLQGSDMQGEDVLKELLKIDPNVKAIVFSGHSTKPIVANYKEYGFKGRLNKPVTIEKLSKVLLEVCEG